MAHVLERGNIYFVYRPKVEQSSAAGLADGRRVVNGRAAARPYWR